MESQWPRVHSVVGVFFLALLLTFPTKTGFAQSGSGVKTTSSLEASTQALLTLHAQYNRATGPERVLTLRKLTAAAATRRWLLSGLIALDPAAVLRNAAPARLRESLPPEVRQYVEEEVTLEGVLEVTHQHEPAGNRYTYALRTDSTQFSLHFSADPPGVPAGSRVRVKGVRVGQSLALGSDSTSVQRAESATGQPSALPSPTLGAQRTAVILINFQDNLAEPYTPGYVHDLVFTQTSRYFYENSYGQTWLTGDVYGWFTIPLSSTGCNQAGIAHQAKVAARAAGVDLSPYTRYVYVFPRNACAWLGAGPIGVPETWVNGSLSMRTLAHELGHNFGLYHSHALECGSEILGTRCTTLEYGDTMDVMGSSSAGHFNAFQKERLGWLNSGSSPPIIAPQADGTYVLDLYEPLNSNPKALKIPRGIDPNTGARMWYYVEYRRAQGLAIHTASEASGNTSALLDMTPETVSWSDPWLLVGKSFHDPDAGVTILPVWANGENAGISVGFLRTGCARQNPTASLLGGTQTAWPGITLSYTVRVTNNDSAACEPSGFTLHAAMPAGWTAIFTPSTLSLSPGSSASATLQVKVPNPTTPGFQTIKASAKNTSDARYASWTLPVYLPVLPVAPVTPNSSRTPQVPVFWGWGALSPLVPQR